MNTVDYDSQVHRLSRRLLGYSKETLAHLIAAEALAPLMRNGANVARMKRRGDDIERLASSSQATAKTRQRTPRQIRVWNAAEEALGLAGGGREAATSRTAEGTSA